jgi:hypothetical protein
LLGEQLSHACVASGSRAPGVSWFPCKDRHLTSDCEAPLWTRCGRAGRPAGGAYLTLDIRVEQRTALPGVTRPLCLRCDRGRARVSRLRLRHERPEPRVAEKHPQASKKAGFWPPRKSSNSSPWAENCARTTSLKRNAKQNDRKKMVPGSG